MIPFRRKPNAIRPSNPLPSIRRLEGSATLASGRENESRIELPCTTKLPEPSDRSVRSLIVPLPGTRQVLPQQTVLSVKSKKLHCRPFSAHEILVGGGASVVCRPLLMAKLPPNRLGACPSIPKLHVTEYNPL